MADLKRKLRWELLSYRIYDGISDFTNMASMLLAYLLMLVFHLVALLLLGVETLLALLGLSLETDTSASITDYHNRCAAEIEQQANSIADTLGKFIQTNCEVKRVARIALDASNAFVLEPADCIAIIEKIRLTREERSAIGTQVSTFLAFILKAIVLVA